jgi:hypothetical protein
MLLLSKTMVLNRLQNEIASAIFYHSLLLLLEETAAKWLSPQNMLGVAGRTFTKTWGLMWVSDMMVSSISSYQNVIWAEVCIV